MADKDDDLKRQIQQVLESDNAILESCRRFLNIISPTVDAICNHVEIQIPNRNLVYRCIIKRAQENLGTIIATVGSEYPYMSTIPLRPLCEDLIYGAWLRTLSTEDGDRLIALSVIDDLLKSIGAQNRFLYYSRGFSMRDRAAAQRDAFLATVGYILSPPSWPPAGYVAAARSRALW